MRALFFLLFFCVVSSIVVGVHRYLWTRLVRDPRWPARWTALGTRTLQALAVLLPLRMLSQRRLPRTLGIPLAWVVYLWMGAAFLLFVSLAVTDLVRAISPAAREDRRTFVARLVAGVAGSLGAGLSGAAVTIALAEWTLRTVPVTLRRLPRSRDGFTIVQLTDVHVGPTIGKAFIEALVARVNALSPDLVAITGDLVDGDVATLGPLLEPLRGLRARHGVFFVTGNHEFISGVEPWVAFLPTLGIRVLHNERVTIGDGDDSFELAGVEDRSAGRFSSARAPDLARALRGWDRARELVLLAHQPKQAREAAKEGVGLVLSGHTHGGQIWPFSVLVRLDQPWIRGLHRAGETQVYVSEGTGYWGPPMRLGTRGEITRVVLRSA
ncbi:MAG: metallophosphoesterase [Polyangiales bacterium]